MPSWRNLCNLLTTVPGRFASNLCYLVHQTPQFSPGAECGIDGPVVRDCHVDCLQKFERSWQISTYRKFVARFYKLSP